MPLAAKDMGEVHKVKDQLNSEFNMKDLGAARRFLLWRLFVTEMRESCTSVNEVMFKRVLRRFQHV